MRGSQSRIQFGTITLHRRCEIGYRLVINAVDLYFNLRGRVWIICKLLKFCLRFLPTLPKFCLRFFDDFEHRSFQVPYLVILLPWLHGYWPRKWNYRVRIISLLTEAKNFTAVHSSFSNFTLGNSICMEIIYFPRKIRGWLSL